MEAFEDDRDRSLFLNLMRVRSEFEQLEGRIEDFLPDVTLLIDVGLEEAKLRLGKDAVDELVVFIAKFHLLRDNLVLLAAISQFIKVATDNLDSLFECASENSVPVRFDLIEWFAGQWNGLCTKIVDIGPDEAERLIGSSSFNQVVRLMCKVIVKRPRPEFVCDPP